MIEYTLNLSSGECRIVEADAININAGVADLIVGGESTETIFGVVGISCDMQGLRYIQPYVTSAYSLDKAYIMAQGT